MSWEKRPGCARSNAIHVARAERPSGGPSSIAHISPRPRTSRTIAWRSTSGRVSSSSSSPIRSARSTRPSCSSTRSVASARGGGEIVAAEGGAVAHGALHAVEDPVEGGAGDEHRADRDEAPGERLGDADHVGLQTPVLQREKAPGAPKAGLHLVADEQRARLAAKPLRAGQVAGRGGG